MADIRDFISGSGKESTVPLAYLLLMANVLGLAVFIDGKPKQKNKMIKPYASIVPETTSNTEIISDANNIIEETLEEKKAEKPKGKDIVQEPVIEQEMQIKHKNKNNVIDFKQAVALKTHDIKQPLKPLIWHFPEN